MANKIKATLFLMLFCCAFMYKPGIAAAQQKPPSKEVLEAEYNKLKKIIEEYPSNLDNRFKFAQIATKLGKAEEAEKNFQYMLRANPRLPRVKLELALLYAKTGKFKKAKGLFEEVLKTRPPENVKKNIDTILAQVNDALKKDVVTFSATLGINRDSNATSAASTGETTFSDVSIPLAQSSLADADSQIFASAGINHLHKFDIDSETWGATLTTNGTFYKTSQETDHNLDLSLVSFKTGPALQLKKLRTSIGVNAYINLITLNSFKYIKTRGGEFVLRYAHNPKLVFDYAWAHEYRKFANSPSVVTNVNRTGNAYQHKLGATYIFTPKDIFNVSTIWRSEEARNEEFGNDQLTLSGSYTRQLPYDMALNILGTFKKTHYNDTDPLVSSTTLRNDRERSMTFSLIKKLPKNVTVTGGYQYKNVTSNIQNYDYFNHRFSGAIGWTF